jgi:membrane protease subunit (stomatin/prohibitin family)
MAMFESFAIECPKCGAYAEAKKGVFAGWFGSRTGLGGTKQMNCTCGYTIDIRTESLTTRQCPTCNNVVAYDQLNSKEAKCPVCKTTSLSAPSVKNIHEADFACSQCGCTHRVAKDAMQYECYICGMHIDDVQARIYQMEQSRSGLASVLKYEGGNSTLVWKHPVEDFNIGSQLIVHETQEAIFFRDGQALDSFPAGRYTLETGSIPLINNLYNSMLEPSSMFHSEVYFVNLTTHMGIKWGTDSKVRFLDPITGIPFELGASGEFNLRVIDPRTLVMELVGTESGLDRKELLASGSHDTVGMSGYFRTLIMTRVKTHLAQTIKEKSINILEIDLFLDELSAALRDKLNEGLKAYGLFMPEFFVTNLATPDSDKNFQRLKQQHAEQYLRVRDEQVRKAEAEAALERKAVEARTDAQMRIIDAQGGAEITKIQAEARMAAARSDAEAYRMQAEAEALEMQMKGYTYEQETRRQIGLEAVQGGIVKEGTGGGDSIGGLGNIAGLGIGLGAMGAVVGMTRDAIGPIAEPTQEIGRTFGGIVNPPGTPSPFWDCLCGSKAIQSKFCPDCGTPKPVPAAEWNCPCGQTGITKNFCGECGTKREAATGGV